MKKLLKKLLMLSVVTIMVMLCSVLTASARIIKGYPGDSTISFEPRVEYEFTGPHMLYINDHPIKRNILRQKIYDNGNNMLLTDNVYIPLDDMLYELNSTKFEVTHESGHDNIAIGLPYRSIYNGKYGQTIREVEAYNLDYDIRTVQSDWMEAIKYQGKYYITPEKLDKMVRLVIYYPYFNDGNSYYDTIVDAAVFNSDSIMQWLITTPEYRQGLIESYYKAMSEYINVSLDVYKQNCPESTWNLYTSYKERRCRVKNKWKPLYSSRW